MASLGKWRGLIVPAGLLAAVLAIFLQIPPVVLDFFLAANLAIAAVILLTTFYVKTPLEFSVFPTVLLAATLGRLALNIASTRLILLGGESMGADAGGQVIRSFGEFVAGNHMIVGLLIFLILVAVQFLVITSGATRISEVAARFSLDSMPGRQMAIDSDVNAGTIAEPEARLRRLEVMRESDFYGAMDGASKFVRGDAVAGLLIMAVNLCGGLVVGMSEGMGPGEAAGVYARLTIGDGLVSQIPALLISLSAGILVSRASQPEELPNEMLKQLTSRPEALAIAAVFLVALISAKLPVAPLLTLSAACGGLAWVALGDQRKVDKSTRDAEEQATGNDEANQTASRAPAPSNDQHAEWLQIDPLTLELGTNLLKLASPSSDDHLMAHITYLREQIATELGMVLPPVRVRDNPRLDRNAYRITMSGAQVAHGMLRPAMKLATVHGAFDVVGEETLDPVTNKAAWWIPPSTEAELRQQGCDIRSPIEALMDHFRSVARRHAAEMLTRDAVQQLLESLQATSPVAASEFDGGQIRLGDLQQTLQSLLDEGVSIRPLGRILEALSDAAANGLTGDQRHGWVRRQLGRLLVSPLCDENGRLHAIVLNDDLLERIQNDMSGQSALEPGVLDWLRHELEPRSGATVAVVVEDEHYGMARTWIQRRFPGAALLALSEVPPDTLLAPHAMPELSELRVHQGAAA